MKQSIELTDDDLALLARVAQLRVVTAEQARFLLPSLVGKSVQAARACLKKLTSLGLLQSRTMSNEVTAAHTFKLATRGMKALGRERDRHLRAWPLSWSHGALHFRNNVYARLVEDGWTVAGPALTDPSAHAEVLEIYKIGAIIGFTDAANRADAITAARYQREAESLDETQPKQLTFDLAFKQIVRGPIHVVLLAIDDPRHCIVGKTRSSQGLIDLLPRQGWPGMSVLARDHFSTWRRWLARPEVSDRQRAWREALVARFGDTVVLDDERFSTYWAHGGYKTLWRLAEVRRD